MTDDSTSAKEQLKRVQEIQEELRSVEWGELPLHARFHAEIADDSLTHVVQVTRNENGTSPFDPNKRK